MTHACTGTKTARSISSARRPPTAYQARNRKLYQGRALLIVRGSHQPGAIEVRATAGGLPETRVNIEVR
ncbi:MAG: hypothetical protein ACLP9L_22515 [Thermoguttaceae bacterium]